MKVAAILQFHQWIPHKLPKPNQRYTRRAKCNDCLQQIVETIINYKLLMIVYYSLSVKGTYFLKRPYFHSLAGF